MRCRSRAGTLPSLLFFFHCIFKSVVHSLLSFKGKDIFGIIYKKINVFPSQTTSILVTRPTSIHAAQTPSPTERSVASRTSPSARPSGEDPTRGSPALTTSVMPCSLCSSASPWRAGPTSSTM